MEPVRGVSSPPKQAQPRHSSAAPTSAPIYPHSFAPQIVERSNIIKMTHLSKEEIIERLEQERFHRLQKAASNLKADMLTDNRCPLCTLVIPCNHFDSLEQLYTQRSKLFNKQEWSMLSQDNRNAVIKLKMNLQKAVRAARMKEHERQIQGESQIEENHSNLGGAVSATRQNSGRFSYNQLQGAESQHTFRAKVEAQQRDRASDQNKDLNVSASQRNYKRQFSTPSYLNQGRPSNTSQHLQAHQSGIGNISQHSHAAESFLLKVRINALKNKIGFRNLSMEQRAELEERIQQEYFNYHFDQGLGGEDRTALENELDMEEVDLVEQDELRQKMHPWHGKSKQERKEYIEKLLLRFKGQQIVKERATNAQNLASFSKTKEPQTAKAARGAKVSQNLTQTLKNDGKERRRRAQSKSGGGHARNQLYATMNADSRTGMSL